jgi:hypothetical protein
MIFVFAITISISIQKIAAFQQIAGPVIVNINPGETKSFSWGLLAGNNETSLLKIYADGNGSEFLSIPQTFRLNPGKTNYIVGNITIPLNHPTNTSLNPIVHSSISENDTENAAGGNAVNVELSKIIAITVGVNKTQAIGNLPSIPIQKPALIGLGLQTNGTINSLITTPATQWIASGNWSLNVSDGNATSFETKMTWNNLNGTNAHSHEFQNLRTSKPISLNQTDKNISIKGSLDVGTNQRVVWKDVPSTININGKKTISISVDDNRTNHHFASQPILGVVNSFLICSDIPGPNMEVLPPCSSQPNSLTSSAAPFGGETFTGVQPNLPSQSSIPQNLSEPANQAQSQNQFSTVPSPQLSNVPSNNINPNMESVPNIADSSQLTSENPSLSQSSQNCENIPPSNATASGFETDPKDYNPPGEAIDNDLNTWWANKGVPSWLQVDLGRTTTLCTVEIAWNKGDERTYEFTIATTSDGNTFTDVFNGKSTGKTTSYEKYNIDNSNPDIKSIKLSFTDSSSKSGWVSIKEVKLIGK